MPPPGRPIVCFTARRSYGRLSGSMSAIISHSSLVLLVILGSAANEVSSHGHPSDFRLHSMDEFVQASRISSKSNSDNPCPSPTVAIIMVKTAPTHFHNRNIIRRTWGPEAMNDSMVTRFVIGETGIHSLDQLIDKENLLHHDIVRGHFMDHYYNLTLKTVSILSYAAHFCPNTWTLLTDDDMVINARGLAAFIRTKEVSHQSLSLYCSTWQGAAVRSDPADKFYVPNQILLSHMTVYPDYCSGTGYLMPPGGSHLLHAAVSRTEPKLQFEDVFVTGLARVTAGIPIEDQRFRFFVYIDWIWLPLMRGIVITVGQSSEPEEAWSQFVRLRDHPYIEFLFPLVIISSLVSMCIMLLMLKRWLKHHFYSLICIKICYSNRSHKYHKLRVF